MIRRLPLVRLPLFWGALAFVGFYVLIDLDGLQGGLIKRYCASHPVEYAATALFFVGIAALAIKAVALVTQFAGLARVTLGPVPTEGQRPAEVDRLLQSLARWPAHGYLVQRLRAALDYVGRKRSATTLDEHLRHLADVDLERLDASYGLIRVIIWAIPILGFLGTVIGITLAVAKLAPEALENSLPAVTAGLGVAFDTTGQALALSILLMFAKFFVERAEVRLLAAVDQKAAAELVGRFQDLGPVADPHLAAVRRMAEAVVESTEQLVKRQTELWRETIDSAQRQWGEQTANAAARWEHAFQSALRAGLQQHAEAMGASCESLARANHVHWDRVQAALEKHASMAARQQAELTRQGEIFGAIVEATGQIDRLERTLNQNLAALAGAKNFEDTVVSLAAAIQLLSTRLGHPAADGARIQLPPRAASVSHAA